MIYILAACVFQATSRQRERERELLYLESIYAREAQNTYVSISITDLKTKLNARSWEWKSLMAKLKRKKSCGKYLTYTLECVSKLKFFLLPLDNFQLKKLFSQQRIYLYSHIVFKSFICKKLKKYYSIGGKKGWI